MRRLCFGGSFNPIHYGHLICARAVAESAGYDKVTLIPTAQPPHKANHANLARPEDRLAMCQLAVAEQPELFEVEDLELRRGGPSYTIDTVRALHQRGWAEVHWLIGADMAMYLPKWYEPQALLAETTFVLMARPGWTLDWAKLPPAWRTLQNNVVPVPQIEISATDLRRRVAEGKSIAYLTPSAVADYIHKNRLYTTARE